MLSAQRLTRPWPVARHAAGPGRPLRGVVAASQPQVAPIAPRTPGGLRVLITGGTKGIGRALTDEFLSAGDAVVVASRSGDAVARAVQEAATRFGPGRACGLAADVSSGADMAALAAFAKAQMGGVDVWLNNAGSNGYAYAPLWEQTEAQIREQVDTNCLGTLLGTAAAVRLMLTQPGGGHIFEMEGAGSSGSATRLFAAYGFTKAGMPQLVKSLSAELAGTAVRVHLLSPGMVFTDLLSAGKDKFGAQGRWFVNALAEDAPAVAAELVPRLRAVAGAPSQSQSQSKSQSETQTQSQTESETGPGAALTAAWRRLRGASGGRGEPSGTRTAFLTAGGAAGRLAARLVRGANKGRYYPED